MGKFIDLTGQRFGNLTVIKQNIEKSKPGRMFWECLCDCGNKKIIYGNSLRNGNTKSCGCLKEINLIGQRFGKLVVIEKSEKKSSMGGSYWECLCDCGNKKAIFSGSLKSGNQNSCGCSKKLNLIGQRFGKLVVVKKSEKKGNKGASYWECLCDCGKQITKAGSALKNSSFLSCGCYSHRQSKESKTRIYTIWSNMKRRCFNTKNKQFKHYGGRGITIFSDWLDFFKFKKWALENGYSEKLSIDRINNDGNYEPNNCRWVNQLTQVRNRRNTVKLIFNGCEKTLFEWAEHYRIKKTTANSRYHKGKSFEEIFEINKEKK